MSLNSGSSSNVVKTALDKVFYTEFDLEQTPGYCDATNGLVFRQEGTDRSAVITEQYKGPGYFEETNEEEDLAQGSPKVGNQKTSTVLKYTKSVDVPKNFFDDDLHTVVSRMVQDMARVGRVTRDKNAFAVYSNGFTTQLTNDGVALFSNSHTTLGGDTVDNLETAALADTSLNTAMTSLIEQKTQDGTLGGHKADVLLVPTALFKTAVEITKSTVKTGVNNDTLNYYSEYYPGLQVMTSPHLGAAYGGSDTAWFLLSRNHGVYRFEREAINTDMVPYQYSRNDNYVYKARYREVVDSITWEGAVASNGTT